MALKISADVSPRKGKVAVAISYSTVPNEKRSVRASSSLPLVCSGDIYATVPNAVPGLVRCKKYLRLTFAFFSPKVLVEKFSERRYSPWP